MNKLIKDEKLGVVIFVEQVSPQQCKFYIAKVKTKRPEAVYKKKSMYHKCTKKLLAKVINSTQLVHTTHCLKMPQILAFYFLILAFFTNFCPIKTDLSGNTV